MSDAPLNDHLGTILSDFEAMRRSFTAEDEHGTHHFCPTSTVNSNFPCCPIKTEDGDEKGPCSSLFNQLLVSVHSSALQDTVLKNRKPNSVSFNNVNTANTKGHAWSGVKRVINCQRKLNPDVSSHTSDAESYHHNFHSLSSSLDYQVSSRINSPANSSQNLTGVNEQNVLDSATVMKTCTEGKMVNYDFKPSLVIASESININQCCKDVDLIFPNSRSPESGAPTNFAYSTSQLRWSPKCHNTKSFKSCSSFSSNQRAPKPESVKQFTQASFDPNSLGTKAQVISAEKLPSKSDCKISSLSALASSSVKGPSKEMLSIQNQRDRNKLLTSPGSCPDSNVKKSLVWNSLHQSPKLKPNLEELNFVTTRRPSQTIVPCEFEQEKAVKDCLGSVLQRVSTFPIANRPRPSGTQQDSYVEEDSVQQSEKLETALDTPRGLKTQVQMEESDTDAMENATCANNTGPEEYTQDHGLLSYVGIETVLDQMRRKAMKTGFEFNIMVVGQSGLGKSTLMNTLFKSKVSRKSCTPNYEEKIHQTVHLQSVSHVIEEKGVKLQLTIIDTPGFGDQINNENCWEPVVKYINEQYEKYLREELSINRKRRIPDTRVHCCVYFLPPTGHCLRPIDVEFMKRLGDIVSIVPVIAKADTLTIEERLEFRRRIQQDLQANGIRVYPQKEYDEDAEDRILNDKIREKIPFAVVGTDKEHQVNGNKVLGRKTKWGVIEVENVAHCEFTNFRDLLIRSHLQDLKDITHNIHYEAYRVRRLNDGNVNGLGRSSLMPLSSTMEEGGFGRQL